MKRTYQVSQFSWVLFLIATCLLMLTNSASVRAAPELTIGHYELVSSKRITRTVFEYTYKADITNTGTDALDVSATLSITAPGVTVLNGDLSFGDVAAGARVTSSDTFAIRQDRQYSFAVDALQWEIKSDANPTVEWTPSSLYASLAAGESTTTVASFVPTENATNVSVGVLPELAPYVSVSPASFPSVMQGASYAVTVTVSAPADMGMQAGMLDGTIYLKQGQKTLATQLVVELRLVDELGGILVEDPDGGALYPVNQFILVMTDNGTLADVQELTNSVGGRVIKKVPPINAYLVEVPTTTIPALKTVMATLVSDPRVDFATTDTVPQNYSVPSDLKNLRSQNSHFTRGYDDIFVEQAWELIADAPVTTTHVSVGIIDTGIDGAHPEFELVERFGVTTDTDGHGTSVAGIIGAGNLSAIASLRPDSPEMNGILAGIPGVTYSLGIYQQGRISQILAAIEDAYSNHGVRIFNFSFGWLSCTQPSPPEGSCPDRPPRCTQEEEWRNDQQLFEQTFRAYEDALFIAASGNASVPAVINLPGGGVRSDNVITVASMSAYDGMNWSCFSNGWNPNISNEPERPGINIAAPGELIYAPVRFTPPQDTSDYEQISGTSAAAPMVTGVAVMMKALDPTLTPVEIKNILRDTAFPECIPGERSGCFLNAYSAVEYVLSMNPPSVKFTIEDLVELNPVLYQGVAVKDAPTGNIIGTQMPGARGKVIGGPHYAGGLWWWEVDFDAGADGWVDEQFLQRIDVPPGTPITDIDFADSNLRQCVLDAATASGWQTVEQVTALSCAGRNISSLAGLESFINLQTLDLGDNQITDTAPLVNLTRLGQLDLTGNSGIRCMELDGLTATLSSTTITRPADCVQQSGNFVWPVTNPIRTQDYATFNPKYSKYHAGFDLVSATGDLTIYAAAAGKVKTIPNSTFGNENHGMGNVIIIDHNNGQGPFTLYAHLASITVADGVTVQAGTPIGVMGNTGCANLADPCGVHLHFEVKQWGVLGNLHDDLGPHWGYTPGFPNLYGYLNPWPYLDHGWAAFSPRVVRSSAGQIVRTGPSASEYTQILGNVAENQTFVASQQVGDWFEIDFPSEHGPAKGWIQATAASNVTRWRVTEPARGLNGTSVCPTTDACASSPSRLSYVWDLQRIVELEQVPAQSGCSSPWIKTWVPDYSEGWVCGDFLMVESSSATGTGKLNDTGITWCANDTPSLLPCPVASHPGQDGDHGRDALARAGQLQKVGGGMAGFDFTKLDANGNALPANATQWDCVRDNHTGLIWEVKTTSGLRSMNHTYTWYNPDPTTNGGWAGAQNGGNCTGSACDTTGYVQAMNAQGLCGASDWRMPTRRELQGIVEYGRSGRTAQSGPWIDTEYFPNTPRSPFWSASPNAYHQSGGYAWLVDFSYGDAIASQPNQDYHVRLVRGGE